MYRLADRAVVEESAQFQQRNQRMENKSDSLGKISLGIIIVALILAALFPYPATKFFLAFTLGLFFIYLCFSRIDMALCWFIFLMPILDLFPPDFFGSKGINAQTIMISLLIIGSMQRKNKPIVKKHFRDPMKGPILLLIGVVLCSLIDSTLFGEYPFMPLLSFAKNWLIYIVLYFIVLTRCDREHYNKLFFVMLCTITIMVLYSLRLYAQAGVILSERSRNPGALIAGQPNLFGGFLAMYIPFFIVMLATKGQKRFVPLSGLVICGIALITTLSRGSWLALLSSVTFLGIIKYRRFLVYLALAWLLMPFWLPSTVEDRLGRTSDTTTGSSLDYNQEYDSSTEVRVRQWKGLPTMVSSHPILGNGFRSFPDVVFRSGVLPMRISAHATLVRMITEHGLLGAIAYLSILITILKNSWYVSRESTDSFEQALATGLMGCVVSLFIADLSGTRFYCNELTAYFWMIAAMVMKFRLHLSKGEQSAGDLLTVQRKKYPQVSLLGSI